MNNRDISRQLDEQRMIYAYQAFNCVLGLLNKNLAHDNVQQSSSDILAAATTAYQQGKITKSQYFAVINALDEPMAQQTAYSESSSQPSWNQEYLQAKAYLDQYRK